MQTTFWKNIIRFAFLALLQALVLEHIHLPGSLHLIWYPIALMLLPMQISKIALILLGFGYGMLIDVCCGTPGLNAFAATLLAFARILYFEINDTRDVLHDSELSGTPLPANLGWGGFLRYSAWMTGLFCLSYFIMESLFRQIVYTLYLTLGSAVMLYAAQILTVSVFVKRQK